MMNRRRIVAMRRRQGVMRNIIKSGQAPASVSPINRRRQPVHARSVSRRRRRPQRGWRIGAMSGSNMSAMWLAVVLVGAYLLFHKRS